MPKTSGGAFGTAGVTAGTIQLSDGTALLPSFSWGSLPTTGFYANSGIGLAVSGAQVGAVQSTGLLLVTGKVIQFGQGGGSPTLIDDGSNILAVNKGGSGTGLRVYAGNGGFMANVQTQTESLTIAAAATTVGATSIPAGAILLGVSVRVTTIIPTAATFTYATTVGATALSTAAVAVAAGSTDPGTAAGASYRAAATTVTITPNLTPGAATGVVRLQYYYLQVTPPTS